jgi:hypothetical protein
MPTAAIPPANFDELVGRTPIALPANSIGNHYLNFRFWTREDGKVFDGPFALDVATPKVIGNEVPEYILGAAADGKRGFFIPPSLVFDFLHAHWGEQIIFHSCPFDLVVLDALLKAQGRPMDIYALVDGQKVWDTQIVHRLYSLATDGHTCQGEGQSNLDFCTQRYLGVTLRKVVCDADGNDVRTSWGRWHGRPLKEIPSIYLDCLGKNVLSTFGCWREWHCSGTVPNGTVERKLYF